MKRTFVSAVLLLTAMGASAEAPWKVIEKDQRLTVATREEPGRNLPTMRGQGVIQGDVAHVLAVILDAPGATEWAEGADECKLLKTVDERTHFVYSRTDTPWPVSDRDMVMRRTIEILKPGEEFRVRLLCAPKETPALDGVIRVTSCDSHFHLRRESATTTYMEYQINIDPAGALPEWLVRWAAKKIPRNTFTSLEKQVKERGKRYDKDASRWASAK